MFMTWFAVIVVVVSIAIIVIVKARENPKIVKDDVMPNADWVIVITKTEFTENYHLGILTREGKRPNKNGTYLIKFVPQDYDQGEGIPRPRTQSFSILQENLLLLANGRRKIWMTISENPGDFPEPLRATLFGGKLQEQGLKAYMGKTFKNAFRELTTNMAELQNDWAGGEVTAQGIEKMKEMNKKIQEMNTFLDNLTKKAGDQQ